MAAGWMLLAATILGFLFLIQGVRPDFAEQLANPRFAIALSASLATGVLAATGCFLGSLPDRSRYWLLLPLPALIVWISTIGYGCLTDLVEINPSGMQLSETALCFLTLLVVSAPLSAATFVMLRHVGRLRPAPVTMTAGLAVAGIASAALSIFHQLDATILVLVWNVGMAGLVAAANCIIGRQILQRAAARVMAQRGES
jgi:hypothetical protein